MTDNPRKWRWFYQLGSPKWFYANSARWLPWLICITAMLLALGLFYGLYYSPPDYQQGHSVRIMYIHVPAAFLSMAVYATMAVAAAIGLVWQMKLSFAVARSCAPIGVVFTFLALATGAIWGKPTWGTWWEWDARLTSELVLLFLYLGFIALHMSIDDTRKADKIAAVLALVGVINLPIIHFSVEWWNSLHQTASISKFAKPSIEASMLRPLLIMIVGFFGLFFTALVLRVRNEILLREHKANWLRELVK